MSPARASLLTLGTDLRATAAPGPKARGDDGDPRRRSSTPLFFSLFSFSLPLAHAPAHAAHRPPAHLGTRKEIRFREAA